MSDRVLQSMSREARSRSGERPNDTGQQMLHRAKPLASFVGSPISRRPGFGRNHPLSIPRVASVMSLCEALGWWDDGEFRLAEAASGEVLSRFHDADYIQALRDADQAGRVEVPERERYAIGTSENPIFPGVFERAATAVGGSILAAQLALEQGSAFHPAGGTHHGMRDRAHGFCYFNDPAFAIQTLLDGGAARVLYVDLDAHHGDGVQQAFLHQERVLCVSIHERDRWPHTGAADDRGAGFARNFPVPPGFHDAELAFLMNEAVLPQAERFGPEAVVITCGTDALAGDPLSAMALSNCGLWEAVDSLRSLSPATVVLGGGGYNPWTLARCWTGLWARLSGRAIPDSLPEAACRILRNLECDLVDEEDVCPRWLDSLADPGSGGEVRDEVMALAGC